MTDLLHQLTTKPTFEHTIWIILLISVCISMLLFISRFEDDEKFTSVIIPFITFIAFSILFGTFQNHINQNIETAITNKEYTLTLNGAVLELTSNSPYLKSEILDVVEINLENLFEEYFTSCSSEENAARLQFLIDNTESVLSKIKDTNKSLNIVGHNTPNYELVIYTTKPNNRFFLTAYSNIDDDMLWDEMIEWVDDLGYNDNL